MDTLEQSIITACIALIGWAIKDIFLQNSIKKNEAVRIEWERRLKEIWSPLFYWSGVVLFNDSDKTWDRHGAKELENILIKSAHILPLEHYYTLVRLLEKATNQKTTPIKIDQIAKTRDFIYRQIQLLNYLLYRREDIYEADYSVDVMTPYKLLLRASSTAIIHLLVWVLIISIMGLMYFCYLKGLYLPILLFILLLLVVAYFDIQNRNKIYKETKRLSSKN